MHFRVALAFSTAITLKYKKSPVLVSDLKSLAEHLLHRRQQLGLGQRDAAIQMGIGEFTLLTWEKGTRPFDRYWPAILSFLGYDPRPAPGTFGERIVRARQERGWGRKEAAKRLGIDEATLKRCEADLGQRSPEVRRKLERLLSAVGKRRVRS